MGLQRQNKDIRPTPKSTQQAFETICRLYYITLQRQGGGVKMTSNGNTAQKLIIKNFIKETNEATKAKVFLQSLEETTNGEQMKTIEAIAKKFNIKI